MSFEASLIFFFFPSQDCGAYSYIILSNHPLYESDNRLGHFASAKYLGIYVWYMYISTVYLRSICSY